MPPEFGDRHAGVVAKLPDMRPHLVLSIDSSQVSVRSALVRLRSALVEFGLETEAMGSIELVLAEVLNNIEEHAYRGMEKGRIELSVWNDGDTLLFKACDTGIPMPNGKVPVGRAAALDCPTEDIPEGGYGWYLIRHLTAELDYARIGNRNQLTFRMRRDARPVDH